MVSHVPKVLVGIVTYEGKHYIFPECYKAVQKFDYPNYDVIIVDNSEGTSYVSKLRREGYQHIHHIKRAKNSRDTLSDSQNYIRNIFLKGEYDYLLLVESDLLPPKETIKRLLSHNKDVVGSVYWLQGNSPWGEKTSIPCVFFLEYKPNVSSMGTRLIKQSELSSFLNKGLQPCHGCGFGCTLIKRNIVSAFPFWTDERFSNKHSDVYFYMDLHNKKIPVFVDSSFQVAHYPSDWDKVKDR